MPDRVIPPALPPEFGVYFALLEVSGLVRHGSERQLRDEGGLSFVQFQILATLGEDPSTPRSMTYLADRLVHSKSGLTYQVAQLEQAGLVARAPSPDDDRGVVATLTADGAALLGRVLPGHVRPKGADPPAGPRRAAPTGAPAALRPPSGSETGVGPGQPIPGASSPLSYARITSCARSWA
jgi:DNA-binding MarR family transcriptional regulator